MLNRYKVIGLNKYFLLTFLLFISIFNIAFGQDIKEVAKKLDMSKVYENVPRFILDLPNGLKGVTIVYDDFNSITPKKIENLKDVELVELRFSNQFQLDKEVELLRHFPQMKYLVLSDWTFRSELTKDEILLPEILANYKNIEVIKIDGNWRVNYEQSFSVIRNLPNLRWLYVNKIKSKLPESIQDLNQLKGIQLHSSSISEIPKEFYKLSNLESVSLSLYYARDRKLYELNYYEVLNRLQVLPHLKSLFLESYGTIDSNLNFANIKLKSLAYLSISNFNFRANKSLYSFISNQRNLVKLHINGFNHRVLDNEFLKLNKLGELELNGRGDTLNLQLNFNQLKSLQSLKIDHKWLNWNYANFPTNLTSLALNKVGYKTFPTALYKLKSLKSLTLFSDSIKELPVGISKLKELEILNLAGNKIQQLPSDFNQLINLKTLNLSKNPIKSIGDGLEKLINLETLNISHLNLNELPSNFGNLKNLKYLIFDNNNLTTLPNSITKISSLISIDGTANNLISLPDQIGDLKNLEELKLDYNNIKYLPVSIGLLERIRVINMNNNALQTIPDELANLRNLEHLNLSSESIENIKKYYLNHNRLSSIKPNPEKIYTTNNIQYFPDDLTNWDQLKSISLSNNRIINKAQLIKSIFKIPAKKFNVALSGVGIDELPEDGWSKFNVQNLYLNDNNISKIPVGILDAPNLSQIQLGNNNLPTVPINLNQNLYSKYQMIFWFSELGFIKPQDFPKEDNMVREVIERAQRYSYRNDYENVLKLYDLALQLNPDFTTNTFNKRILGETYFHTGKYDYAIKYLTEAIKKDTAGRVRIMNAVIPSFEIRAKSYLKLGDTLSAIQDYTTLAENFTNKWADVALLNRKIGKEKEALVAFDKAIINYDYLIDPKNSFGSGMPKSIEQNKVAKLELLVISEDFNRAYQYALEIEKDITSKDLVPLLVYLKACAEVANNKFDLNHKSELVNYLAQNRGAIQNWSYALFFNWLSFTKIDKDKVKLLREFTDILHKGV